VAMSSTRQMLFAFLVINIFISCSKIYFDRDEISPLYVRMPDFNKEECVETNGEEFIIKVKEGDCLSKIVQWCLNEYLQNKGNKGMFKFRETLYEIVNSIKTKSGNHDLIYPSEVISFRLPERFIVYEFDYYRPAKQVYGLDKLKKILDFYWLISYNKNVFNCSERSAFVKYYLENEGFNTAVVGNENHAWVIVEYEPGERVNVECVSSPPAIGKAPDNYKVRYENIYEAIEAEPREYDWWNRVKGAVIGRE